MTQKCCTPTRGGIELGPSGEIQVSDEPFFPMDAAIVPSGKTIVGTKTPLIPDDGEGSACAKTVKPFRISTTTLTNEAFAQFVADTGYVTEAEHIGWSFVFYSGIPEAIRETQGIVGTEWWRKVDSANWCGGRLPRGVEREHAARGGLGDVRFPWGDEEPDDSGFHPCNIWQGRFPVTNTTADGSGGAAPAKSFEPNGFGLYNMVGNVWEWTADPFRVKSLKKNVQKRMATMRDFKLLKGGSYLCHRSYCYRYRVAARIGNTPDSATSHQDFRIVWNQ